MKLSLDQQVQLSEDAYKLERMIKELKTVDMDSVNDHKTGDFQGDKLVTEGLFWALIRQVEHFQLIARNKLKGLYAK